MIKSLKIQNFQSHEKTEMDFSKGVNVIVGSSDSGKTSIIRALRWLVWNRPSGDAIRSTWGGDTNVRLVTDEDNFVIRSKGKTDTYITHISGDEDVIYKAIGTSVPEEVQGLLTINEINLQSQLDAPFLLSDTPGEVAQHFNRIAKLDKIDSGIQNVQRAIRELEQSIKFKSEQAEEYEEELKKFAHLEKFEADVEVLEEMEKRWINKKKALNELELLCGELQNTNDEIDGYIYILSLEKQVNSIEDTITLWGEKKVELIKFEKLVDHIRMVNNDMKKKERLLKFEPDVNKIIWDSDQRDTFKLQLGDLGSDTYNLIILKEQIESLAGEEKILQTKFKKEMGNVCILCGQSINK
jgi:exonuclease SbcC